MNIRPLTTGRDRPLLPESRFAGPMPWVIAIMMFLMVLTMAAGLGLSQAARHLQSGLADRVTLQIVEANPRERARQAKAAVRELGRLTGVVKVERLSPERLEALLAPWLGDTLAKGDIPMPEMIDVDLAPGMHDRIGTIGEAIRMVAPSARLDDHGQWLAPLEGLIASLKWLAVTLILLMVAATAFTVVLATRATLDTHHETIGVMHLLGATDSQIAQLFQRRIALDSLLGGMLGFGVASLVVMLLADRIGRLESDLIGSISLSTSAWLMLLIAPLAGTALAMLSARATILRALGRIL